METHEQFNGYSLRLHYNRHFHRTREGPALLPALLCSLFPTFCVLSAWTKLKSVMTSEHAYLGQAHTRPHGRTTAVMQSHDTIRARPQRHGHEDGFEQRREAALEILRSTTAAYVVHSSPGRVGCQCRLMRRWTVLDQTCIHLQHLFGGWG